MRRRRTYADVSAIKRGVGEEGEERKMKKVKRGVNKTQGERDYGCGKRKKLYSHRERRL